MTIHAYHFVKDTLRDGRPVPPDGEWLAHEGPCILCEKGLHASIDPYDALCHAPGPVLCLVECDDIEDKANNKLVCRKRRILRRVDLTEELRAYARWCALQVIHLWDAPDIVHNFLKTGDPLLQKAAADAANAAYAASYAANAAYADAADAAYADAANAANAYAASYAAYAASYAAYAANAAYSAASYAAAYTAAAAAADAASCATASNSIRSRFYELVEAAGLEAPQC